MRYGEQYTFKRLEILLKGIQGNEVKVVRWLIQEEDVRV